ncbi:MAG: hypothetical protein U0794_06930 [Isosphaeraceae bacterium]
MELGDVLLATNRIRFELLLRAWADGPSLWLDVEEREGGLVAGVSQAGWLVRLNATQRQALDLALAGWLAKCGVALVQTPGSSVMVNPEGTLDLATYHAQPPEPGRPVTRAVGLEELPLTWRNWVDAWQAEADESRPGALLSGGETVLPEAGMAR